MGTPKFNLGDVVIPHLLFDAEFTISEKNETEAILDYVVNGNHRKLTVNLDELNHPDGPNRMGGTLGSAMRGEL